MFLGELTWQTLALALLVGILAGVIGLTLRYGLQTIVDELIDMVRGVVGWVRGRALEPRTSAAPWFCVRCHSANVASASHCYRGCGDRSELEDLDPLGAHTPPNARPGTARRRG
jgi:hypothetical protein